MIFTFKTRKGLVSIVAYKEIPLYFNPSSEYRVVATTIILSLQKEDHGMTTIKCTQLSHLKSGM